MRILLTGFKPFGKNPSNPTLYVIEKLKSIRKEVVETLKLEVVYGLDGEKVIEKIEDFEPDIVLCLGLATSRSKVCLEAVAMNARDSSLKDNQGQIFNNERISNGPLTYDTNLDLKKIQKKIANEHFMISYSAGTYVCNDVYYQVLEYIYKEQLDIACGFVHIPHTEPYMNQPYLDKNEVISLVSKLLDVLLEEENV